jgi:hypothetical protein
VISSMALSVIPLMVPEETSRLHGARCGIRAGAWLGLLLGDAVNSATAFEEWPGVDGDDLTAGVVLGQDGYGRRVVGVAEAAGDDAAVDDEVVDVAVVDESRTVGECLRCGDLGDVPGAAGSVVACCQRCVDITAHRVVRVCGIALTVNQEPAG